MQQHDQQNPNMLDQLRTSTNVMMVLAQSAALPLEVLLHRRFGRRYLDGVQPGIAAVTIVLWPLLFPESSIGPMTWAIVVYLVLLARARLESYIRHQRGHVEHSRYSGLPWLCSLRPDLDELTVKRFIEPIAAILVGFMIADTAHAALGSLIVLSGIGMLVNVNAHLMAERTRQMDMQDAVIDAEQLRNVRGGRRS